MKTIHHVIVRSRRRIWFLRTIVWSGRIALALVAMALVLMLADRLLALALPAWVWLALPILGLVGLIFSAFYPSITDEQIAHQLDERLGLKDRLGTALHFQSNQASAWDTLIQEEAQRAADQADVAKAFPVKAGRAWSVALPAMAVGALMFVLVPTDLDLLGWGQERQQQQAQAEAQDQLVQDEIVHKAMIRDLDAAEQQLREAQDPQALLDELATLSERQLVSPDLQRDTAARLSELTKKIDQAQKQTDQQIQTLQNNLSRLNANQPGPADRFADALRRGDFQAAQRELDKLAQQMSSMTPEQQQAMGQQLQSMSAQLQQMAQQAAAQQQATQQQIQQQLQNAGLSQQQIQQLQQQNFNQQAVQQALQQQGMNQQQAQQLSQQIQQQQQQAQNQQQAAQTQQGLSSSLGQMGQACQNPSQSGKQGQQQGQQAGQQSQQGQQGQQAGQQGQQGQQGGQQGGQSPSPQFQQAQWAASQQLQQMSQMQNQLQQMQQAQSQAQQAMQKFNPNQGPGNQQQHQSSAGKGGQGWGVGTDPNVMGQERQPGQHQSVASSDIQDRPGPIITSWTTNQAGGDGSSTVSFDSSVTQAQTEAERAVTEDRVPRRYHQNIRDYFNQLPETAEEERSAPAAPR